MRFKNSLPVALLTAFLLSPLPVDAQPPELDGDAKQKADRDAWVLPDEMGGIYTEHCAVCHGDRLQGAAQGPSLLEAEYLHGDAIPQIVESIAIGFPEKGMPRWREIISADDIRGLAIYILEERVEAKHGGSRNKPLIIPSDPLESEHHAFRLRTVYGGIEHPYSIAPLPDGRILFTEKSRGLSILSADGTSVTRVEGTPKVYADGTVRGSTYTGSGWMHEVELHPDYESNGWIYLSYGDRCEDCNTASRAAGAPATMLAMVRGRIEDHVWKDQQLIWQADKESYQVGAENGVGGRIAFDGEGHVFLTMGVLVDYRGIQDLSLPYGKIHRVHDDGRLPEDNPFVDVPNAVKSTWTLGHRNPQGIAYDQSRGVLWSSEHGPRGGDEGNIILPGRNYGWPLVSLGVDYDGRPIHYADEYGIEYDPNDLEPTTIDWTPSPGVSSIVFYTGDAYPAWSNQMLVATLNLNELWRVVVDRNGASHTEVLISELGRFRDIEIAADGAIVLMMEHPDGSQIVRMEPVAGATMAAER